MTDPTPEVSLTGHQFATSVFKTHGRDLHRWLTRRLRSREAADDVIQEVFLRISRKERIDYVRKPLSYLFGIAFYVISELHVKERDGVVTYDSDAIDRLGDSVQNCIPDEFVDQLNLRGQLEKAFDQLPPHYKTVLLLCKRDGMSYEEAAAVSGLSVHTVEKYLVRARARIMALNWDR